MTASLSDLTAVIKAFERPECVDRLIRSIRRFYPSLHIIVCDDSFNPHPLTDVEYVRLPPDVGLSAGRNEGVKRVRTPYFLLLDDDVEFSEETCIERLLEIVSRTPDICLAAGAKRKPGAKKTFGWHGFQEDQGDVWRQRWGALERRDGYDVCDVVANFFVAETELIRNLGWDSDLKQGEHEEFFVRFKKANLKAAFVSNVVVIEHNSRPPGYQRWRNRGRYWHLGLRKHGIRTFVNFAGKARRVKGHSSQIVLGVGSGGCGTGWLAQVLRSFPGARVSQSTKPILSWHPPPDFLPAEYVEWLRADHGDALLIGSIAFFYLNYLEQLIVACPEIRVVCLKQDKATTMSTLERRFSSGSQPRNHFTTDPQGNEIHNAWSMAFPKYGRVSLREGLRRYYEEYYATAQRLTDVFPANVRLFEIQEIKSGGGVQQVLDWVNPEFDGPQRAEEHAT